MRSIPTILTVTTSLAIMACASTGEAPTATAVLETAEGAPAGVAHLEQTDAGVRVRVDVVGLEPGVHGVHVHAVGFCEGLAANPFQSAGGHFNPDNREHGLENPDGPHAGDLPNMTVVADGSGTLNATTDRFTLDSGPRGLFDADGSAVIIHTEADDLVSDPAGDAGARVACGVVRR